MFVCTRNDYPLVLLKFWKLTLSIYKLNGSFLYPNAFIFAPLQSSRLSDEALASCTTFLCLCKSFKELFLVCLSVYFRKASAKVWTFSIPSKYFSRKIQKFKDYWFISRENGIIWPVEGRFWPDIVFSCVRGWNELIKAKMYQCNMKHVTSRIYHSAASSFKTQSEAGRILGYHPVPSKVYKFTVYSLH